MVRVHKLALAIAAASALSSGVAHALGLGEVTLRSALNQPLVAEIELLEARDVGSEEVVPALASPEDFNKAGVDRHYFLNDLKFSPIIKPNGKSIIRVTSSKPVREPYLNFLVEVLWPSGRLLREYTLLLDPPLYSSQTAMSAAQKSLAEQTVSAVPRAPAATAVPPALPRPEASNSLAGKEYKTRPNDTLWKVAERVHTSATIHQTMLAIQDLNPQAFLDGNINLLVSGQVLRLPDDQQIGRRSESQALAEVAAQNSAWRGRRARPAVASVRQLDATRRNELVDAPARVETGDSLRLVAADSGKAAAGSDKGADGKVAADKLAVAKENLDATQRENAELKSRMEDLQSQLDKLQRLITLKDEQLAKLQASVVQTGQVAEPAASASVPPGRPVAAMAPKPAAMSVDAIPAPGGVPAVSPSVPPIAPAVQIETAPAVPAEPVAVVESPSLPAAEPVADSPVVQLAPSQPGPAVAKPVASQPGSFAFAQEQPVGLVDSILDNSLLLPSLGGAAAALLLGLLVARRRAAKKKVDLEDDQGEAVVADTRLDAGLSRAAIEPTLLSEVPRGGQVRDVLGEVEEHIAYGRFKEAAEVLQAACNAEPQRSDLRLKLMEVYAELGDREGFARQEKVLREEAGAQTQVDHLRLKYPAMAGFATAVLAGSALAAGLGALKEEKSLSRGLQELEPGPPDFAADMDLSLDELEAELERDLQSCIQDDASLSLDDLTLDEAQQPAMSPAVPLIEDFSFDLDLAGEMVSPDLKMPGEPVSMEDKDPLSLDLDALDVPVVAQPEVGASKDALLEDGMFDSFDLAADLDSSSSKDRAEPKLDLSSADKPEGKVASALMAQLDALDFELEQLAVGLGEKAGEVQPVTHSPGELVEGEDFDFLADADEIATKLDLARAYIEMGDTEGARDILDEVLNEGNETQRQEAREVSARLA